MKKGHIFSLVTLILIFLLFPSKVAVSDTENENLEMKYYPADNYADDVIETLSQLYLNDNYALGAPDGKFANIFYAYDNGILTLDLGRYETASDSSGDDFIIHSRNGTYLVKVGNDLSSPFTALRTANETESFNLSTVGFTETRFVQIHYASGDFVEIDAVEVINLYTVITDNDNPIIDGPEDYWVYENVSKIALTWDVSDATPWNYSIFANDTEIDSAEWYDINISFDWIDITIGVWNVTLILYDYFGNTAEDTVIVEIRDLPTHWNLFYLIFLLPIPILVYIWRRRRNKST